MVNKLFTTGFSQDEWSSFWLRYVQFCPYCREVYAGQDMEQKHKLCRG